MFDNVHVLVFQRRKCALHVWLDVTQISWSGKVHKKVDKEFVVGCVHEVVRSVPISVVFIKLCQNLGLYVKTK